MQTMFKLKTKYKDRVDTIWFEDEDGYWALLHKGWTTQDDTSAVHAWTLKDVESELKLCRRV